MWHIAAAVYLVAEKVTASALTKSALCPGLRPEALCCQVLSRICECGALLEGYVAGVCAALRPTGGSVFMLGKGVGGRGCHLSALMFFGKSPQML